MNNVYVLMYDIDTFQQILTDYPEIEHEVILMSKQREYDRVRRLNQQNILNE